MTYGPVVDLSSTQIGQLGLKSTPLTAGGSGDNTSAYGEVIDTTSLGARYHAAQATIVSQATMASGNALTVVAQIQHSSNNSDWASLVDSSTAITHTAAGGAAANVAQRATVNVAMWKTRRYVRVHLLPNLSATGTDTALVFSTWAFANPDKV